MARPAGDQLPLRRRAADGRQPRDLQERRQGDREPERLLDHVHGEARPHLDRQLLPRPHEPLADGENAFAGESEVFGAFLAGWIECARELALFLAPTINSYKRYAAASWAPTTLAWGRDNRTCGFRIVGHGASQRVETRIPGGDVNPYLAFAALIAAGLYGIEQASSCRRRSRATRTSRTRRASLVAPRGDRRARGRDDGAGRTRRPGRRPLPELRPHRAALFDEVVTCWERERLFERG